VTLGTVGVAPNWSEVGLVVFDVDGTLYSQRGLRWRMLREMILFCIARRQLQFIAILRAYRTIREELGDSLHQGFEQELVRRTAALVGCSETRVESTAQEWLEERPLRHLIRYRYPGLVELFRNLRSQGKKIGIFSDYPARKKLNALGLDADFVVCAGDEQVQVLKPHAKGLLLLMSQAGMTPDETVLVGDRVERDGLAARAAGVPVLIRSRRPISGWETFRQYNDPVFPKSGAK
jgi:HAD superfamily hydrolase (TIGR01549 family)